MSHALARSTYRPGGAWFICDRCSQRFRRAEMFTEWDGLKVDALCLDPRPPQMTPPDIYPEGVPFVDARPPADAGDALMDDSTLAPVTGGITITTGQSPQYRARGQTPLQPGDYAPQDFLPSPVPANSVNLVQDDKELKTGPVFP